MNAKKCKELRAGAKQLSVDKPKNGYTRHPVRKYIIVHPSTFRGIYRMLKKASAKKGANGK